MSWGDVRGLLQYVPQFRGRVFVMVIDAPVSALAETMLDLVALQNIGVQLVIGSSVHGTDVLLDRAAEVELSVEEVSNLLASDQILTTLNRGQFVVADFYRKRPLSQDVTDFSRSISAKKLILLTDSAQEIPTGAIRAADISAKSSELLQSAAATCDAGIPRVHLLDGSVPGVLLSELFSNEGAGTMVYADSYRTIRPFREEDIVELLGMIGRSVRNAHLVPRDYADIEENISDYSVMVIDGNVVGSVALLQYEGSNTAEVACLYVKQSHEGLGYGAELVRYAEQQALTLGLSSVFSLTNRAAAFFRERMGYDELPLHEIPKVRQQQLLDSGRDSRVFGKSLIQK